MHFPEIEGYLRELERVMDVNGKILASVFIAGGAATEWFLNFAYTDEEFRAAFDRARLKVSTHQPGEHAWYVLAKAA